MSTARPLRPPLAGEGRGGGGPGGALPPTRPPPASGGRSKASVAKLLRQPLLHFIVLGALLSGLQTWVLHLAPAPPDEAPIRIDPDDVDQLRAEWLRDTGREPTQAELRASVARRVDEEVLLREALRRDLDRRDPVARERLLRNMRFAFPQRRASDDSLLHEARLLGMSQRDVVVRRRLIQVMERRLAAAVPYDDAALRAYVADHAQRYGAADRYTFRHVFFSSDRPRADARADAEALRLRLAATAQPHAGAGDPFLLGARFVATSPAEISARFGEGFADALAGAPLGEWIGPLQSPYGRHLVRVDARVAERVPDFEPLRGRAVQAWIAQQQPRLVREQLRRLRQHYRVEVAGVATVRDAGA